MRRRPTARGAVSLDERGLGGGRGAAGQGLGSYVALVLGIAACSSPTPPASPPPPLAVDAPRAQDAPVASADDDPPVADSTAPGGVVGLVTLAKPLPAATRPTGSSPCRPSAAVQLSPYAGVIGALVWLEPVGDKTKLGDAAGQGSGSGAGAATTRLTVDGCAFVPRAVIVSPEGTLVIENLDAWRHELTPTPTPSPDVAPAAWVLPVQGSTYQVTLPASQGPLRVTLDDSAQVALAMRAPSPWATITDLDGKYVLPDVPAGRYRVRAAHAAPGGAGLLTAELEVEVPAGVTIERPLGLVAP